MAADGETEDIFLLGDKDEYSDFIGTKGVSICISHKGRIPCITNCECEMWFEGREDGMGVRRICPLL